MRFDSTVFVLDHEMVVFSRKWHKPDHVSMEGLPGIATVPTYHFIEENCPASERILQELKPYVKGFLTKQAVMVYMPDDASPFTEQRYMRDFFVRHNASENSSVRTFEFLCQAEEQEYIAISRSERNVIMTYRPGRHKEAIKTYIPLPLASYEAVDLAIDNLGEEVAYNEPEIFIFDPMNNMKEYYPLGKVLDLQDMSEMALKLSADNQL